VLPESEESKAAGEGNYFKPQWVDIDRLTSLPFGYWQPLQANIVDGLQNGFSDVVEVVRADKAR
jgi:hypothetical protein